MDREKTVRPFGWRDKVGYMFGDFGNDFTFLFASTFLMIFYTKIALWLLKMKKIKMNTTLNARFVHTCSLMRQLYHNACKNGIRF